MSIINWIGENIELILWIVGGIGIYEFIYNSVRWNYDTFQADLDEYYRIQYNKMMETKRKQKEMKHES